MKRSRTQLSGNLAKHGGAAGGSLLTLASRKGGLFGALLAIGGAFLLYKAVTGARAERRSSSHTLGRDVHLSNSIAIDCPASDLYEFWRDFSNLPRVMGFLERVEPMEGKISHWVARLPAGPALEWDSEVVEDVPNQRLSWRSLEGSDIDTWGTVTFEPSVDQRKTEVSLKLNFNTSSNPTGNTVAHFLRGLEASVLSKNMRKLKAYMEEETV